MELKGLWRVCTEWDKLSPVEKALFKLVIDRDLVSASAIATAVSLDRVGGWLDEVYNNIGELAEDAEKAQAIVMKLEDKFYV